MPTSLKYLQPRFKPDEQTELEFAADFFKAVNAQIKLTQGRGWEDDNKIVGTLLAKIKKSKISTLSVSVSIKYGKQGHGGYIRVFGWSEVRPTPIDI